MEHGRDEENEYIIQDMIFDNERDKDERDEDVVSSYLNQSGDGVEEPDRRDGSGDDEMEGDEADGSSAGTKSTTKSGEVYHIN